MIVLEEISCYRWKKETSICLINRYNPIVCLKMMSSAHTRESQPDENHLNYCQNHLKYFEYHLNYIKLAHRKWLIADQDTI
jgi:hypothetical protein